MLAAGCTASLPAGLGPDAISPAELLRAEAITGPADPPPLPDAQVLAVDDDMRRFLVERVGNPVSANRRLTRLIDAVMGKDNLGIDYNDKTYTAAEAFHLREANCLSFTNMFVALARSARLPVSYQEVDVPPDWSLQGDTMVLNRHINAIISTKEGPEHVVDFNIADFRASYDRRKVPDERAFAHYYSNLGAERLQANDRIGALRYLRKAVEQDETFTAPWVNLGTLYMRARQPEWASAAWRHALAIDPGEVVALSNLERLYREQGNTVMADEIAQRIERHRMRNPYYRYYLARRAFDRQDYDSAIEHMRVATRQKKSEDTFYALLGMSYLRRGDTELAREWIMRAEQVAEGDQRTTYHSKLEMLRRINEG